MPPKLSNWCILVTNYGALLFTNSGAYLFTSYTKYGPLTESMDSDNPSEEKEVSNICLSCGMCCDGTLFDKAVVRDNEDRAIAEELGMFTYVIKDKPFFKLPCHHFSSCCTVYSKQRPHTCGAFFCVPIRKYKKGDQTISDAKQQVKQLLEYRNAIMQTAAQFPELRELDFGSIKNKLEEFSEVQEQVKVYRHLFLIFYLFEDARKNFFEVTRKEGSISP